MKTRDRILAASLELFNEEGEAEISALDVANALEISPGHLYYHFKGKDALIQALFDDFEGEMRVILQGAEGRLTTLEEHWLFLYILLEEVYDFRFYYRSLGLMAARYPGLNRRLLGLNGTLRGLIETSLDQFGDEALLARGSRIKSVLIDQLVATLTFWLEEDAVGSQREEAPSDLIHSTVLRALLLIAPYLRGDRDAFNAEIMARYETLADK
ncbi:MAG: TetR/AcrR family transcriptional regulator [Pseudomonadota bacterium]